MHNELKPATSDTAEFRRHWRALIGSMMGASVGTVGFYSYTAGAFVGPLTTEGFTRAQLSLAALLLNVMIALSAPFAGSLMDRYGALRLIGFCVLGEAVGLALLGATPISFPFYAGAIVVLALLGVGTTPPGFARIVTTRFDLRRGLALGIMISGPGLTAMTAPIWMTGVIEAGGWRAGYWCMASLVLLIGGAGVTLIRRDRGDQAPSAERPDVAGTPSAATGDWSALRRPAFWALLFAFIAPALFGGGYLLHMIPILRERGFTPEQAALMQSLIGVAIVVGRLSSGAAIDRFPARHVAIVIFTISAIGCAMLLTDSALLLSISALAMGLTIGAELDILAYLLSRYFGLDSFGRLYSLSYSGMMVGSGASPFLIASLSDHGGEPLAFIVSAIGTMIGVVILIVLKPARLAEGTLGRI